MRLRDLEARIFLALLLAVTAIFLWLVRAFLQPIFWAAVFAVLFRPVFLRLAGAFRGRRVLAAVATVFLVVLIVLIPFGLLLAGVAQQALLLYSRIAAGEIDVDAPIVFLERSLPTASALFSRYGIEIDRVRAGLEDAAIAATQYIAGQALSIGQNVLVVTILFVLMLYLLFFFLRDGERVVAALIRAIPMGDERERRLLTRMAVVSRATVWGTLVVAIVQGTLGGLMFAVVGIEAALLWGVMMGILSLLPAVGPALVWIPAAVVLFSTGAIWSGVFVVVAGTLVIGLVDNVLRPILIGRETEMPDYLILLATLGGIGAFGITGFVAGPLLAALFLVMWDMFADEYAALDAADVPPLAGAPDTGPAPHDPGHPIPAQAEQLGRTDP